MYSQVGPRSSDQSTAAVDRRGSQGIETGQEDVLLGEGTVPFSLLKALPLHYLPMRLLLPHRQSRLFTTGTVPVTNSREGVRYLDKNTNCRVCRFGEEAIGKREDASDERLESAILGIGLRMVFPTPSIPEPPLSTDGNLMDRPIFPGAEGFAKLGNKNGGLATVGDDELLLRVYEAEALVREGSMQREKKVDYQLKL